MPEQADQCGAIERNYFFFFFLKISLSRSIHFRRPSVWLQGTVRVQILWTTGEIEEDCLKTSSRDRWEERIPFDPGFVSRL